MRKVLIIIFFTTFTFLHTNCWIKKSARNSSQTGASPTLKPTTEAGSSAANVKAAETPVPAYSDAETALAEGNKFLDASENEKAVDAYRQAVKLNPDLAEAYFKLGIAYSLLDNEGGADEEAAPPPKQTKKSKKGKKDAPALVTKADKAFDKAVKAYKKILAKNPKDDAALFNLGRSYNKLNQDEEAEKALKQAVKLKPDDSLYQTELGAILIKLAHYDEAVAALKKARQLDDTNLQVEELLEQAEAGKKRVDYGVNKIVKEKQQSN